ncbi:hypothetical protein ES708_14839 [subsurface metagenome]
MENLLLDIGVQYTADTYQYYSVYAPWPATSVSTTSKKLDGCWLANFKLRKKAGRMEFFSGMDNIFNKDYTVQFGSSLDDRGYPMPGRTVSSGLKFEF